MGNAKSERGHRRGAPPSVISIPHSIRPWAGFVAVNTLVVLVMFWPAMTGEKILAPVDIPPNLFSKFRYVDPGASGVPDNHYVIDLMLGDLSRNLLVYQAWRNGEMPWWDPFTDCGKPLAAEANAVNVSDPFKVILFHLLPFELAYNWIRIVPFLVSGMLAFGLLRHFGFAFTPALWGGCSTNLPGVTRSCSRDRPFRRTSPIIRCCGFYGNAVFKKKRFPGFSAPALSPH